MTTSECNTRRMLWQRIADAPPPRQRAGRSRRGIAALLSISLAACGEARTDNSPDTLAAASASAGDAGPQAGVDGQDGRFEIGRTSYSFRVVRCDRTGQVYDGMVLQGRGTAPDGRHIAVSVDRTGSDMVTENAFISFGNLQDGDNWSATRTRLQDGRWFADEGATEPASGPLIEIAGSNLSVQALFHRESDDTSEQGVLRATCPT